MPESEVKKHRCMPAAEIAAKVARLLDEAQVPNVLWGFLALGLVGKYEQLEEVEFVVSDHLIESASNALTAAGFPLCMNPDCDELRHDRFQPIADVHFHLEAKWPFPSVLLLFTKSRILWWLPDFELGAPSADDPNLTLSNDPQLPPRVEAGCTGPWSELYPIKILNPNSFTEAVILLLCRDHCHANGFHYWWCDMIASLIKATEFPDTVVKKHLRPQFQPFWHGLNYGRPNSGNIWVPLRELRAEMIKNNELPPAPPINAYGSVERARAMDAYVT